jgi:hypothetical protein
MERTSRLASYFLCAMILIVSCSPSGTTPARSTEEPLPEDIGIRSFFFTVNPATIVQGECAVVRWSVEPEGDWPVVFNNEQVEHVDQREVCPDRTHEYELWADPPGPDIHEEIITLEVVQPGSGQAGYTGDGEIITFSANPERIRPGECTQLHWEAAAPPDLHFILNGEPVPASGTKQVCPAANTVFELLLLEPSEAVFAHVDVIVDQAAEPAPASTQATPPPASTATVTPGPLPQATATPTTEPTASPTPVPTTAVQMATLIWPTPTQTAEYIANPEIYLRIVDIFLVNHPIGEVNVRIKNTSPERIETPPFYEVSLSCSTTIYSPDHAPVAYSGYIKPDIRLDPGEVGIYRGFYQAGVVDQTLDFTNGWGDVTCYLTFNYSSYAQYAERLP